MEMITVQYAELHRLIKDKIVKAGLTEEHAEKVADNLAYADASAIHSHGAVRVEYYSERIAKGGITHRPDFRFEKTGSSTGIYHGDNGVGHAAADYAMDEAIKLAKETGIGVVGISRMSHSGVLAPFVERAAKEDLVAISVCQSDPMAVPFGGSEPFFGTNPIAFAAPVLDKAPIIFDMATTVQAWGKVLDARAKNQPISDTWAVDVDGNPTTDPHKVNALLPIAGPKGYGLMLMVDILSGSMLGLPFGKHVTSMYEDLSTGRELGQLHIVIDPAKFTDVATFKANLAQMTTELNSQKPQEGFKQVLYPGQRANGTRRNSMENGIPVVKEIYDYLVSDDIHYDRYDHGSAFAK